MNNDWIEWTWTEEKPYPETLETKVYVRFIDGIEDKSLGKGGWPVGRWGDENMGEESNWYNLDWCGASITHYKLA